jgi:hypothetical protein
MSTKLAIRELYFNPCCRVLPGCRGAAGVLPGCCRVPRVYLHHPHVARPPSWSRGAGSVPGCRVAGYCRVLPGCRGGAGSVPGRCRVGVSG